jgi:hypothetical protein
MTTEKENELRKKVIAEVEAELRLWIGLEIRDRLEPVFETLIAEETEKRVVSRLQHNSTLAEIEERIHAYRSKE